MEEESKFHYDHSPKGGSFISSFPAYPNFVMTNQKYEPSQINKPNREDPSQPTRQRKASANKTAKPTTVMATKGRVIPTYGKSVPPSSNQGRPSTNQNSR